MTFTLSAYKTAVGIVDMMTHVLERYFTTTPRVEITDRLAEGLLMGLMAEAPRAVDAEYPPAELCHLGRLVMRHVCHPCRNHYCKTGSMGYIGIHGADFVFHEVRHPVFAASASYKAVVCHTMVERLHANKGDIIGGYYKLGSSDTRQIYELMLAPEQVAARAASKNSAEQPEEDIPAAVSAAGAM